MAIPLDPTSIPKYANQLMKPPVYHPTIIRHAITKRVISHDYTVTMSQFNQQILPPSFPQTTVWGYGGSVEDPDTCQVINNFHSAPGPTFEAVKGIPINVQWKNKPN